MPNQAQWANYQSRSSRGEVHTTRKASPNPFPFFKLPGELRNRIYGLVFEDRRVGIWRTHPRRELLRSKLAQNAPRPYLTTFKHKTPHLAQPHTESKGKGIVSRRTVAHLDLPPAMKPFDDVNEATYQPSPVSDKLLLTCRLIRDEAVPYLYSNTQFVFKSPNTLLRFLRCTPKAGLAAVRYLEVHHNTYGEPRLTEHCEWKVRSDEKWFRACITISEVLTGLTELTLHLGVCDWPTKMELTEDWALPLLILGDSGRKLDRADVVIKHRAFDDRHCKIAAEGLEDRLMTEEGRERKQIERAMLEVRAREIAKVQKQQAMTQPPKARKTLVIKKTNILDEIARVNPYVYVG